MKELFNYRYYVLIALAICALTLTFMQTDEDDLAEWLMHHLTFKTVALVLYILMFRLIDYWNCRNKITALTKLSEHAEKLTSHE